MSSRKDTLFIVETDPEYGKVKPFEIYKLTNEVEVKKEKAKIRKYDKMMKVYKLPVFRERQPELK